MTSNFWGASLAILAAILSNIGTNAQKHSHLKEDELPPDQRRPYMYRGFWWIGFIATLLASIGDFLALALASQALVSALGGGTTLVTNVLVARFWNKDRLVWSDVVGVVFIVAGATYFAVTTEPPANPTNEQIKEYFTRKWFVIYLATQLVIIIVLLSCIANSAVYQLRKHWTFSFFAPLVDKIKGQEERIAQLESQNATITIVLKQLLAEVSSIANNARIRQARASIEGPPPPSPSMLQTQGSRPKRQQRKLQWYDKYTYAACAGAIGGLSVLFGSCTGKSMANDFDAAFSDPAFWGFLMSMLVCVVVQTHLLNESMQLGGTMAVFPVFEAFWISFGVLGGLAFYNNVGWGADIKQAAGALFMLVGVGFLMMHPENARDKKTAVQKAKEATLNLLGERCSSSETLSEANMTGDAISDSPMGDYTPSTYTPSSLCTPNSLRPPKRDFEAPTPERVSLTPAEFKQQRRRPPALSERKVTNLDEPLIATEGGQPLLSVPNEPLFHGEEHSEV